MLIFCEYHQKLYEVFRVFVITLNYVDEPTASEVNPLLSTAVVPVLVPFKKFSE